MKLLDYVNEYFNGNKAAFGRAFNKSPQHITKIFNDSDRWLIVIEDKHHLVQIKETRAID